MPNIIEEEVKNGKWKMSKCCLCTTPLDLMKDDVYDTDDGLVCASCYDDFGELYDLELREYDEFLFRREYYNNYDDDDDSDLDF